MWISKGDDKKQQRSVFFPQGNFSSQLGVYQTLSWGEWWESQDVVRLMLLWVFATGHLIRRSKWMRPSTGSLKQLQALVFVGDFNYPDICWRSNIVKHKQSRRFLESGKQRLQLPVTSSGWSHKEWCIVWPYTNREGRVADVKIGWFRAFFFLALKNYKCKFPQWIWGWKKFHITNLHLTEISNTKAKFHWIF